MTERRLPCGCVACFTRRERAFEAVIAGINFSAVVDELDPEEQEDLGEQARQLLVDAETALEEANAEFEDFAQERESGDLPFDSNELLLAALLALLMLRAGAKVQGSIRDALTRGARTADIERALSDATPEMRRVFAGIRDEVQAIVTGTVGLGVAQVPDATVTVRVRERVIRQIVASVEHFTNRYFETHVVPAIMERVNALAASSDPTALFEGREDILGLVDARFRNVAYWRMTANLAASRAYHYSLMHAAQSRGIRGYRFVAVIDQRTSRICRSMNGREFWIADGIAAMDRAFDTDDPEAARAYLPWVDASVVDGASAEQLAQMGVLVPPLHPHCRSTLQPIF